ncbi:PDZ domain-containing protein [Planctomycetota bacterium]
MTNSDQQVFNRFPNQLVIMCVMAILIVIVFFAMFTSSEMIGPMKWIGMTVITLKPETASEMGIDSYADGVIVEQSNGLAAQSGIRRGDLLLNINGLPVRDMASFAELAGKTDLSKSGAQLVVIRHGVQIPVNIAPGQTVQGSNEHPFRNVDQQWLGIDADTLTAVEARALGIPSGIEGVLLDSVTPNSRAEQAGLNVNDVIVSVNSQKIDTVTDLWNTLCSLHPDDQLHFSVYRNGHLTPVTLSKIQKWFK